MRLEKLWLADFRSYESAELALAPGLTAVLGDNGRGKSNLLEAVAWLATLESFRGAPTDALIRAGADRAILRAEGRVAGDILHTGNTETTGDGRMALIEAELVGAGRNRVQVNRQRLQRTRDLLGVLRVSVFTPDDLELVKGGPGGRRRYLDQTLVALHPRYDAVRSEVERVLKQRNALLRQVQGDGRRVDESAAATLDVWDQKLAESGEELARLRVALVERLVPALASAYRSVAVGSDVRAGIGVTYESVWHGTAGGLAGALAAGRRDDVRRGVSLIGPHRDDLALGVGGIPARTHASQGEQRSLALALRLAAHAVVAETAGSIPVLLLDDVFSELDRRRADALLASLPSGQALLTSATGLPAGAEPDQVLRIEAVDDDHGGVRSNIVDAG